MNYNNECNNSADKPSKLYTEFQVLASLVNIIKYYN